MDKEKLNENVSDIEEKSVEIDEAKTNEEMKIEDTVDTEKEDVSKKKKVKKERSNGFKALMMLLCTVVILAGIMIAIGGWNPFKNREPEKQAVENYEESLETSRELWIDMGLEEYDPELGDDQVTPKDYAPDGEAPYGFVVSEDNGKDGKNGVLKSMWTSAGDYYFKYGLNFTVYYMKNSDYAKEQYIGLRGADEIGQYPGEIAKEYDIPNGKVTVSYTESINGLYLIIVRDGTTLYRMDGDAESFDKMQSLFDKLNIDFKVPSPEELKK